MLDGLNAMNELTFRKLGDPETKTRIAQYEMAFRMQSSVPELTNTAKEPAATWERYGPDARKAGSFAQSCLMGRRLAERGVRFIQVYHRGWDVHGNLPEVLASQCKEIDQPCWALVQDLKERGMLDDTPVIVAGEFGRTIYSQGKLTPADYGRDHHPRCFSLWMAGGGIQGGVVHGETDEFSYNITRDPVHVRDFQATILHQFGIDHEKFTYKYQGLDMKLTGVEKAEVVKGILGQGQNTLLRAHACAGVPRRSQWLSKHRTFAMSCFKIWLIQSKSPEKHVRPRRNPDRCLVFNPRLSAAPTSSPRPQTKLKIHYASPPPRRTPLGKLRLCPATRDRRRSRRALSPRSHPPRHHQPAWQ